MFPSPVLRVEGRPSEHPGSRQLCTQYIARDSNQQNYHRELLDQPRCTKFVFKSAKKRCQDHCSARRVSSACDNVSFFLQLNTIS